jgi:hypothetical protein
MLIQYLANFPFRHAGKALLIQEIFQAPKKQKTLNILNSRGAIFTKTATQVAVFMQE